MKKAKLEIFYFLTAALLGLSADYIGATPPSPSREKGGCGARLESVSAVIVVMSINQGIYSQA